MRIEEVSDLTGLSRATLFWSVVKGRLVPQARRPMSFEMSAITDFVKRKLGPLWNFRPT